MRKLLSTGLVLSLAPLALLAAGPAPLDVSDAWVRALPPGQANTAAYLVVTNSADEAVTIVGASSPLAKTVEMHTSREVDGLQRMERLDQVQVAPGERVAFAPGGKHLMLLGLSRMPSPGEEVQLCLQLAKGGEVCTLGGVRKGTGGEQTHQHHQH